METIEIQKTETLKNEQAQNTVNKPVVEITGSVALLEGLIAEGTEVIFGYPGGAIMPIYDALYDYKEKLEHILVRHEQGGIHTT